MAAMVRIKGTRNIQWYPRYSLNSPLDSLDHKCIGMKDYSKRESTNFRWWTEVTICVDVNFEIQRVMEIWNFNFCKGYKMHFTSQNTSFSFSPVLLFHIETTLCAEIIARFPLSSQCRYWIQSSVLQAAHGESLWKSYNYSQFPTTHTFRGIKIWNSVNINDHIKI